MYGLLGLLIYGGAHVSKGVADAKGKAEGRVKAIQRGDCVYYDR